MEAVMKRLIFALPIWLFLFFSVCFLCFSPGIVRASMQDDGKAPGRIMADQAVKSKKLWGTTDHSKHKILKKEFKSGPEVTKTCLSCHTEAAKQFHKTIHWTWMDPNTQKDEKLGKGGLSINNF